MALRTMAGSATNGRGCCIWHQSESGQISHTKVRAIKETSSLNRRKGTIVRCHDQKAREPGDVRAATMSSACAGSRAVRQPARASAPKSPLHQTARRSSQPAAHRRGEMRLRRRHRRRQGRRYARWQAREYAAGSAPLELNTRRPRSSPRSSEDQRCLREQNGRRSRYA
jgi:hypothetical protein